MTVDAVIKVMHQNADNARTPDHGGGAQAGAGAPALSAGRRKPCSTSALITAPDKRDPALAAKLDAVAGRVLKKG